MVILVAASRAAPGLQVSADNQSNMLQPGTRARTRTLFIFGRVYAVIAQVSIADTNVSGEEIEPEVKRDTWQKAEPNQKVVHVGSIT